MDRLQFEKKYAEARRRAIELDFMHLNDMQREAVMATEGPLLLLAGAGSGKTTVLINRIANVLKYGSGAESSYIPETVSEGDLSFLEDYIKAPSQEAHARVRALCAVEPAKPWEIIAITFTNKAAGELKERLARMLGPGANDIWAMTFHSACARILRRDIDRLGYDRAFTVYDSSDSASLMKRIIKELQLDDKTYSYRTVLSYISRAKDGIISPEEFLSEAEKKGDIRRQSIGRAYLEYANRLKAANALDFDDLILMTVRLFRKHPDVMEYYREKFKYVLIDEYQDTNNLQYILASSLTGNKGNICVVGDDDQSIYKFRGATIENILSFEKRYKTARVIRLEQNYRSHGYILDAANDVICKNKSRKGKKLWTENEKGEKPALHLAQNERGEAQFVADTVIAGVTAGGRWQDNAVLYRMNAQSNQLETAFKRCGVPYRIIGGTGFYERAEIKDMLAYMCVIQNPGDDLRLLRIINNPPRGIGARTTGLLSEIAAAEGASVFDIINISERYDELNKSAGRLHQFADMIMALRETSETVPLDVFYDELVRRTGYVRMLEEKENDENIARIENVNELKTNIVSFMKENGDGTLFDFLSETALYTDMDNYERDADCVVMMTMHSSKGLEFDTVFIVGAEEGIFPSSRAIGEPEEMEEERRLCYVAMTRAKRKLYFIAARNRMLFGKTTAGLPSRFIDEIGSGNIELPARTDANESTGFDFDNDFSIGFGISLQRGARQAPYSKTGFSSASSGVTRARSAQLKTNSTKPIKPITPSAPPIPDYKSGDSVVHSAFGRGIITELRPGGGDALVEISFESGEKKRFMLKSAAKYIAVEKTD